MVNIDVNGISDNDEEIVPRWTRVFGEDWFGDIDGRDGQDVVRRCRSSHAQRQRGRRQEKAGCARGSAMI